MKFEENTIMIYKQLNEPFVIIDLTDQKKADGLSNLFSILQDLHDAHAAVEEEERLKNKNFFLELQT